MTCFYSDQEDNLMHYIIYCERVNVFWTNFFHLWQDISGIKINTWLSVWQWHSKHSQLSHILLNKLFIYTLQESQPFDFYEFWIILKEKIDFEIKYHLYK